MFEIGTYGHFDAMYHTLQAIAMITGDGDFYYQTLKFVSVIGFAVMLIKGALEGNVKRAIQHLSIVVLVIGVIMYVPSGQGGSMMVKDHVTKRKAVVANLPFGFNLFIGVAESLGLAITACIDQAFSVVKADKFSYHDYGPSFGSSLIQETKRWKIQDPELSASVENFLERCVIMPCTIGVQMNFKELFRAPNFLDYVHTNSGDGYRHVVIYDGGGKKSVKCKQACEIIQKKLKGEYLEFRNDLKHSNFALSGRSSFITGSTDPGDISGQYLEKNLGIMLGGYLGAGGTSAEDYAKQVMMLHSFSKFGEYGALRAIQNQENAWSLTGKIAGYYVPMLLTVFKCLTYACFLFVVPIVIFTGSLDHLNRYMILVFSFQLWPALSSILNMFIELYTSGSMQALASRGAVSISTLAKVGALSDKIVAIASSMQMSVPVLSYMIVSGGFGAMVNAMGSSYSMSQSTAAAASELTTGNRSYDNISSRNVSSNKIDRGSSYRDSDAIEMVTGEALNMRPLRDTVTSGAGTTEHATGFKYDINSSIQEMREQAVRDQSSSLESVQQGHTKSKSKVVDQVTEMLTSIDDSIKQGDSYGLAQRIHENKDLEDVYSKAHDIEQAQGVSREESLRRAVEGSVSAGKGGLLGKAIKSFAGFEVDVKGNIESQSADRSVLTSDVKDRYNTSDSTKEGLGLSRDLTKDEHFTKDTGLTQQKFKKLGENISEMEQYEKREQMEHSKMKTLEKNLQEMESAGMQSSHDITPEVIKRTAKDLKVAENVAIGRLYNPHDVQAQRAAYMNARSLAKEYLGKSINVSVDIPSKEKFDERARANMLQKAPQFTGFEETDFSKLEQTKLSKEVDSQAAQRRADITKGTGEMAKQHTQEAKEAEGKLGARKEDIAKGSIDMEEKAVDTREKAPTGFGKGIASIYREAKNLLSSDKDAGEELPSNNKGDSNKEAIEQAKQIKKKDE